MHFPDLTNNTLRYPIKHVLRMDDRFNVPADNIAYELFGGYCVFVGELHRPSLEPVGNLTPLFGAGLNNGFAVQFPRFFRRGVTPNRRFEVDTDEFAAPYPGLGSPLNTEPVRQFCFEGGVVEA